jgi:alkylhydroperoxidase family enzyme
VLEDHVSAPIDDRRKALFTFIDKMNRASTTIGPADIHALKEVGWSEEAIYDAVTVCALFAFYNKWVDATGVQDMSSASYDMSGARLAQAGYVITRVAFSP